MTMARDAIALPETFDLPGQNRALGAHRHRRTGADEAGDRLN